MELVTVVNSGVREYEDTEMMVRMMILELADYSCQIWNIILALVVRLENTFQ